MHDEVGQRPGHGSTSTAVGSVVVGLLVALLTLAAGAAAIVARPTTWTAHTTLLVSPSSTNDSTSSASLYELLTQGQVAATYAALLGNGAFADSVVAATDVARPGSVALTAEVLPNTFLIRVTTRAPTARDARRLARSAAKAAPVFAASLTRPFVLQAVDAHAIRTIRTSNATPTVLGLVLVIALCLSVLAQQLALQLLRLRRRRRTGRGTAAVEAVAAAPAEPAPAEPAPAEPAPAEPVEAGPVDHAPQRKSGPRVRRPGRPDRTPGGRQETADTADAVPAERS